MTRFIEPILSVSFVPEQNKFERFQDAITVICLRFAGNQVAMQKQPLDLMSNLLFVISIAHLTQAIQTFKTDTKINEYSKQLT